MSTYAVMQPYFLPYLGYWQMLNAVDQFVVFDDVQYVNRGWMNRNKIQTLRGPAWISLPMQKASRETLICNSFVDGSKHAQFWERVRARLRQSYNDFEFLGEAEYWISQLSDLDIDQSLGGLLGEHIHFVCERLSIDTRVALSSELGVSREWNRSLRLMKIGAALNSDCYVNSPGGRSLYGADDFSEQGIQLNFFQPDLKDVIVQWEGQDVCLSILDNIARLGEERVRELVKFGSIIKA